uniref:Uncharacterized protein n=1 Tax=Schizaphis graminum TaxID=13262 RepID=A0A2S2PBL9_SCHGA
MIEGHKRVQEFGSPCVKKKVINICSQSTEVMDPVTQMNSEVLILNREDGIENDTPNNSLYEKLDVSHSSPIIEDIDEPLIIHEPVPEDVIVFDFPEMNQQENGIRKVANRLRSKLKLIIQCTWSKC